MATGRHILPALGSFYLDAIRCEDIESWRDAMKRSGMAAATVNGHLRTLRAVLARAVRSEGLRINAAPEVKVLPEDDRRITERSRTRWSRRSSGASSRWPATITRSTTR